MSRPQAGDSGPASVLKQACAWLAALASMRAEVQAGSRECLGWTNWVCTHQRSQLSQPLLAVVQEGKNPVNSITVQRRKEKISARDTIRRRPEYKPGSGGVRILCCRAKQEQSVQACPGCVKQSA